jgi:hypothetical protein
MHNLISTNAAQIPRRLKTCNSRLMTANDELSGFGSPTPLENALMVDSFPYLPPNQKND